jgi:hypothetical protein
MRTTTIRSTSRTARTAAETAPATTPATGAVLSIGLSAEREFTGIALTRAVSPREVIEMLRIMEFNLLLVSATAEDASTWNLMGVIQRHWPELRWVLITDDCSNEVEIMARSLGAASVTSDPRVVAELANYR